MLTLSLCWTVLLSVYPLNGAVSQEPDGINWEPYMTGIWVPLDSPLDDPRRKDLLKVRLSSMRINRGGLTFSPRTGFAFDLQVCRTESNSLFVLCNGLRRKGNLERNPLRYVMVVIQTSTPFGVAIAKIALLMFGLPPFPRTLLAISNSDHILR